MSTSFGLAATTTNDDVIFDVKDDEGIGGDSELATVMQCHTRL